jgi:hypothetical protein
MKKNLIVTLLLLSTLSAEGQSTTNKFGLTLGASIQHYNGNLGNSFFKFNTVCFGAVNTSFGAYLNKSFDVNITGSIGHFGYHPEHENGVVVPLELRCPGCEGLGMGELRSLMVSGNVAIKYKFANDILLKENAKFAPYVYAGLGLNHLSDNMKRNCVNVGYHYTLVSGAGIRYNINEKFNIGYNLGIGCFITKKVYNTNTLENAMIVIDSDHTNIEKRKDLYMQNTLSLGMNF